VKGVSLKKRESSENAGISNNNITIFYVKFKIYKVQINYLRLRDLLFFRRRLFKISNLFITNRKKPANLTKILVSFALYFWKIKQILYRIKSKKGEPLIKNIKMTIS
jgi:hypothetical protein